MTSVQLSSGDLIADRRASYARMLFEAGDFAAAADVMAQALELAPEWPAGLDRLGLYREAAGDLAGAIEAWRTLAAKDGEGMFGAALKLAVHGAALPSHRTEAPYVAALFDAYAERFDTALLQQLAYRVPELLWSRIRSVLDVEPVPALAHAIDLGCGTGLMGERLRRCVSHLTGIDLSAGMIAEARRKGLYDDLVEGEILDVLSGIGYAADLVTAADVFVYCGDLPPIFAAVAPKMAPGGLFAFSLELHEGNEPCILRPSLRYAHSQQATLDALQSAGFSVISAEEEALREDRGEPMVGLVVLARRVAPAPAAAPLEAQIATDLEEPVPTLN